MDSLEMHPVERTFYHPILKYLEDIGFTGITEVGKGSDYVDILFVSKHNTFILEVKVERKEDGDSIVKGIVQAYRYGLKHDTTNLIVISFPSSVRETIEYIDELTERTLKTRVEAVILTKHWYSYETKLNVEELLGNLKAKIDNQLIAALRVESASAVIQKCVNTLSRLINKHYKDEEGIKEATKHLTEDYGLFVKFSSKISTKSRDQTIDLLAYILVNQILFYFLYSKKSQELNASRRVPEIAPIRYLRELSKYFDKLRKIDYRPIFDIFVVSRIPSNGEIVEEVNRLIQCLNPLKISEMRHDVYGRLIGKSLPKETRKILASYYTKPSSADLLANLTIDNWDDTVWDFACGSGTLLVSSYDRKMKLYQKEKRTLERSDEDKLHIRFVQQDITGTDIMSFACHLTGLNLSAKNLKSFTNFLRISRMNALNIDSQTLPFSIDEAYGDISKELERISLAQQTIDDFTESKKVRKASSKKFECQKVDCVAINPPFTGINKLPKNFRRAFTSSSISRICGKRIHLWGYFLALSDKVLKDGGKVGAIIPISIFHGEDTHKLRKHFLNNYSIEYIIKPVIGNPFSEDSIFTDIIFVAKKVKPSPNHKVRVVCLKEDISDLSTVNIETLAKNIKTELGDFVCNSDYFSYKVNQQELSKNSANLMSYFFTNNKELKKEIDVLIDELYSNPIFEKINRAKIRDGHQLRPRGEVKRSVITRRYADSRIRNSDLVFEPIDDTLSDSLKYYDRKTNQIKTIQKNHIVRTLRTLTGIDVLDVSRLVDYILRSKIVIKEKVHLLILNRFWLKSKTLFLTAAYVEKPICPLNMFMMYKCSKSEAKILSLYFNSIFYLVQLVMSAKQSTRGYMELKQIDLSQFVVPDMKKTQSKNLIKLENFFEKYRNHKLASISKQLANKTDYRVTLDLVVAQSLGIKMTKEKLFRIYDLIWNHIYALP